MSRRRALRTGLVALATGLVVAGCGSAGSAPSPIGSQNSVGTPNSGPVVAEKVVSPGESHETGPVSDVMFLQMLLTHDDETDELLALAARKDLSGPARDLVAAIRATQAGDTEEIAGWLREHGEATTSDADPDVHVGHGGTSELAATDLTRLRRADGPDFERELLNLLLGRQHTAVELARAATADDPWVEKLADRTEVTREAEISQALRLLMALPAA